MRDNSLLTGRKPAECIRFGIAVVGLLLGAGGIIVSSAPLAVIGALLTVAAVLSFFSRRSSED